MRRPRNADVAFTASVKRLRAAQKMTMRDLAARCGFAHSVIARIEGGQPAPLGFAAAIAEGLGVPLADMLGEGPCGTCSGRPPAGFVCLSCGASAQIAATREAR